MRPMMTRPGQIHQRFAGTRLRAGPARSKRHRHGMPRSECATGQTLAPQQTTPVRSARVKPR